MSAIMLHNLSPKLNLLKLLTSRKPPLSHILRATNKIANHGLLTLRRNTISLRTKTCLLPRKQLVDLHAQCSLLSFTQREMVYTQLVFYFPGVYYCFNIVIIFGAIMISSFVVNITRGPDDKKSRLPRVVSLVSKSSIASSIDLLASSDYKR